MELERSVRTRTARCIDLCIESIVAARRMKIGCTAATLLSAESPRPAGCRRQDRDWMRRRCGRSALALPTLALALCGSLLSRPDLTGAWTPDRRLCAPEAAGISDGRCHERFKTAKRSAGCDDARRSMRCGNTLVGMASDPRCSGILFPYRFRSLTQIGAATLTWRSESSRGVLCQSVLQTTMACAACASGDLHRAARFRPGASVMS